METGLLAIAAMVGLGMILRTAEDARAYAGIDLRHRLVGARAMLQGLDPYYFQWRPEMGERLLAPWRPPTGNTALTASPMVLLGYACVAPYSHATVRWICFALEWTALALSTALLAWRLRTWRLRSVFLFVAVIGFACSFSWRLHLERGQYYVFVLLILSAASAVYLRAQGNSWRAGALLGLAILVRPVALPAILVLLVLRQWRAAAGACGAVATGLVITVAVAGADSWPHYFRLAGEVGVGESYPEYYARVGTCNRWPTTAEGVDFNRFLAAPVPNVTLTGQVWRVAKHRLAQDSDPAVLLRGLNRGGGIAIGALAVLGMVLARLIPRRAACTDLRTALLALVVLNADYFVPIRYSYVDVLLLLPVGLMLPRLLRGRNVLVALPVAAGLMVDLLMLDAQRAVLKNILVMVPLNLLLIAEILRERRPGPAAETNAATASLLV